MAKKKRSKTAIIKEALEKNPDATTAQIAEGLSKQGINAQYVSTVKSKMKAEATPLMVTRGKKRAVKRTPKESSELVSVTDLVKVKKLVDELGGEEKVKEILDVVSKLT